MIRLETHKLTLEAGNRTLCHQLSLAFRAGENWGILGANGSGKTSLLHALAGLRPTQSGSVLLDGTPIQNWPARERARNIGLLFQDYPPTFSATVRETVLTGRHPHISRWAFEGEDDVALSLTALSEMEMTAFTDREMSTLSGGERRRVEIAAVLAQNAPIGLWDEPTNHLDMRYRAQILHLVAARAARPGHLNLVVLHDVNAVHHLCSHVLLLMPDGTTAAGPAAQVITTDVLERVYGCPFRELYDGDQRYYLPQ